MWQTQDSTQMGDAAQDNAHQRAGFGLVAAVIGLLMYWSGIAGLEASFSGCCLFVMVACSGGWGRSYQVGRLAQRN